MAIRDGKIAAVGDKATVAAMKGEGTEVVDVTLVPLDLGGVVEALGDVVTGRRHGAADD